MRVLMDSIDMKDIEAGDILVLDDGDILTVVKEAMDKSRYRLVSLEEKEVYTEHFSDIKELLMYYRALPVKVIKFENVIIKEEK